MSSTYGFGFLGAYSDVADPVATLQQIADDVLDAPFREVVDGRVLEVWPVGEAQVTRWLGGPEAAAILEADRWGGSAPASSFPGILDTALHVHTRRWLPRHFRLDGSPLDGQWIGRAGYTELALEGRLRDGDLTDPDLVRHILAGLVLAQTHRLVLHIGH